MTAAARILPDLSAEPAAPAASRRRGPVPKVTVEQVRAWHAEHRTVEEMMALAKCSRATIEKRRAEAGIRRRRRSSEAQLTRHTSQPAFSKAASMPAADHPAFAEARSLYPSMVTPVEGALNVLVSGVNTTKIGSEIRKGRWRGFPVYTLTLQERATCPRSCVHWRSCFGNGMRWARRIAHGAALEERLGHELGVAASRHPGGFAVRVHVLGDFYSVEYVELWRGWLDRFPPLHVFGFTARIDRDDPITVALVHLVLERWDRFAIRFSNAPVDECATVSIEHPMQKPEDAVVCPQQLGRTASCSTCAFCWQSRRRVAFIRH